VSHVYELGLIEAISIPQKEFFNAAAAFTLPAKNITNV
jgi:hypothetical protein